MFLRESCRVIFSPKLQLPVIYLFSCYLKTKNISDRLFLDRFKENTFLIFMTSQTWKHWFFCNTYFVIYLFYLFISNLFIVDNFR